MSLFLRQRNLIGFLILFCWISLVPQPLEERFQSGLLIFLVLFLLVLLIDQRLRPNLFSLRDWPLWLFLLALSSGIVSAIDKNLAWATYFYLAAIIFPVFYIGKGIYGLPDLRLKVNVAISSFALLVGILGFLEFHFRKNILYEGFIYNPYYERYVKYASRMLSTQFNPAVLGTYFLACLPFSFSLLGSKRSAARILAIISVIISVAGIILTFSRGVFLGLVSLLLFYFFLRGRKLAAVILLAGITAVVTIGTFSTDNNLSRLGFKRLISGSGDSIISEYRLNRIVMSAKMWRDYPWQGIGFNHFRLRFDEYSHNEDPRYVPYEFKIPDNMYLTIFAESGIIGLTGFLIFIIAVFIRGFRKLKGVTGYLDKTVVLAPLTALVALLVNMGAYEMFYWHNPYLLFCLLCGFVWSYEFNRGNNS